LVARTQLSDASFNAIKAPLALVARSQTVGRGRLGRSWDSPLGGLYLSIHLALSNNVQQNAALSLVVALGVRAALAPIVPSIQIKWPNDIICAEGKLAGILIETTDGQGIVGVGLNVWRQGAANERAAYLQDMTSESLDFEKVAVLVIDSILAYYYQWVTNGYEFASLAADYNSKLGMLGKEIRVSALSGQVLGSGIARGVDMNGQLLVDDGARVVAVSAGEVTLRTAD
jgi:BirA family biotin operon repressor/biotin-[acetyl-CoA-carboxylase] ligase